MVLQTMYPPQKDSPSTFLTGDITATDTLINVGNSAVLPQTVPFPLTLGFDKTVTETVMVTAIGAGNNQLTVTRSAGSLAWVTGTRCARVFTATDLKTLQDNMEAVNTALNGFGQPSVLNLAALKAINTTGVVDMSMIFCESLGLYRFDSGSAVTGDDYFVVVPTTGGGRWLMLAEITHGTSNRFASAGSIVDANGNELIKFPTKIASAVNEVTISNNTTGNAPILQSSGNDSNIGFDIKTKGTGLFRTFVNGVISFVSDAAASAVNYLTFKSNIAGSAPQINATGSDTNIDVNIVPKGTGKVKANGVEVATISDAQTLTNKTLSSPTIGDLTNAQHDHTSAAEGGVVSHTSLSNIGTNTHAQIDTHIADTTAAHGATSAATANKIVIRDVNGRAQVSDPSAAADIATKAYVDARMDGESNKTSVRVATTTNITLSGTQTIDGIAVVAGDRVLVMDQTTGSQNGIYIVATGAWTRATDADISAEVKSGLFTFVQSGTVNGSNGFTLTTPDPITLGTTALTFVQTSGAGQIVDGAGLSKTGNQLDVNVDNSTLEISSDALRLKDGGTTDAKLGNRTITDTTAPAADAGLLTTLLSNIGYMIKSITGKTSWRTAPATTLEAANTHYSTAIGIHGVTGNVVGTTDSQTLTNKTLTAPKMSSASSINDTNGNELIKFPATVSSAVNEVTVKNAATGSAPSISATGNDTNINLDVSSKGTGIIRTWVNGVLSFVADAVASAVNYLTFKSNVTGSAPTIEATGSDPNIDINLIPKGTGRVRQNNTRLIVAGEDYRPNLLINSDFKIWQRGNSFSNVPFNYTADRWSHDYDGSGGTNVISDGTENANGINHYLRWQCSVAGSGNTYKVLEQKIDDVTIAEGQTVTVSFYAKADVAGKQIGGAVHQIFGSGGSAGVSKYMPLFTLTTSWARYSVTLTLDSISGKTIGTNHYLSCAFSLPAGSTFTIDISNIKMEINDYATPYIRPILAEEFLKCQRYFYKISASTGPFTMFGSGGKAWNSTTIQIIMPFKVAMRIANPTLGYSALANFFIESGATGYAITAMSIDANTYNTNEVLLTITVAGAPAGAYCYLAAYNTTAAWMAFDAEL